MSTARLMQMAAAGVDAGGGDVWTDPDLANASYDGVSFSVATQDTSPQGIFFGDGATKLYVVGNDGNDINQYSLSSAWDITSASFVQNFSVNSQETTPEGIFFKPDGTKMYVCGNSSDSVHEYDLSTAWDLSSASFNQSLSVSAQEGAPRAVSFKPDGTVMLIGGPVTDTILQYSISTAWDISTASYVQSFSISSQETIFQSMFINEDGTSLMLVGQQGVDVNRYSLSTAWDVSTMSYVENFSVSSEDTSPEGLFFKSDGSKMYYCGANSDTIYQYSTVASSWTDPDLANASYDSVSFSVSGQEVNPLGLFFKPDGEKAYIIGYSNDAVYQYSLSTAWDVSSASYESKSLSVSAKETVPRDFWFKPDGTEVYVVGTSSNSVHQYSLSTAWDVSSGTFTQSFSVSSQSSFTRGLTFKPDGTKMFTLDSSSDNSFQYSLSTAWDISTASYDSKSLATSTPNPTAPRFNPDGTKLWLMDGSPDDVRQYSLSTAWDVSTGSYDSVSFDVSGQELNAQGLFFKSDGSKMYVVGFGNDTIYQYSTD